MRAPERRTPQEHTQKQALKGLGFLYGPVRPGRHTLRIQSEVIAFVSDYYGEGMDLDVGVRYANTWNITVEEHW